MLQTKNILINLNNVFVIIFLGILTLFPPCEMKKSSSLVEPSIAKLELIPKNIKYGFDLDQYKIVRRKSKMEILLAPFLKKIALTIEVYKILKVVKNKVNVSDWLSGIITLYYLQRQHLNPKAFIYEPQVDNYTVIQLRDSIYGKKVVKPIKIVTKEGNGLIKNSLYETMMDSGLN